MGIIVCNASAGAGKTYTLALKYISLALLSEDCYAFSHILAVTFTNKATGVMKDRILKYLFSLSHENCMSKDDIEFLNNVIKETQLSESTIRERANKILKAIMQDYDHFKVETIDSFFQSLLTSLAHELGLSRSFKVDLDDVYAISQAINRMLLTLDKKGNAPLVNKVKEYLENYVDEKENWNISRDLNNFAKNNLFQDEMLDHETEIKDFTGNNADQENNNSKVKPLRGRLCKCINEVINEFESLCNDEFKNKVDSICDEKYNKRNIGTLKTYLAGIKSQKLLIEEPAQTIVKLAEGLISPSYFIKAKYKETLDEDFENVCAHVVKIEERRRELSIKYNTCKLTLEQLDNLNLLGSIDSELDEFTKERGTHLLAKNPQLLNKLEPGDTSFVYERLGINLEHVMIDEFQDTSRKQFETFKNLIYEMQANGNECMVVGDVKQSIYRWRGGDWDILYNIGGDVDFNKRHIKCIADPKLVNFRSEQLIVRFNNAFFKKAAYTIDNELGSDKANKNGSNGNSSNQANHNLSTYVVPTTWHDEAYFKAGNTVQPKIKKGDIIKSKSIDKENNFSMQSIYEDVEQIPNKAARGKGYVFIRTLDENDKDEEGVMEELYNKIMMMNETYHVPFHDMTILVRKNKEGKKIINYFEQQHPGMCPLTTDEAFMYGSSDIVCCLVYALKFMIDNSDTLSLEMSKRSYQSLYQRVSDSERTVYEQAFENLVQQLKSDDKRKELMRIPLFELLQQMVQTLRFSELEVACQLGQSAYLFSFIDEVVAYVEDNSSDVNGFLEFWDETLKKRSISTHSDKAVSIMTIHKAKGLEKHTVFIPFANFDIEKSNEGSDTLICNVQACVKDYPELKDVLGDLPVMPIRKGKGIKNSIYRSAYEWDHVQQRVDNLNTLYVAFTRAKENLFIWSEKSRNPKSAYRLVKAFTDDVPTEAEAKEDNVYEYGHLLPFAQSKKAEDCEKKETEIENPFDDNVKVSQQSVAFSASHLNNIKFVQSSKARDFMLDIEADQKGENEKYKKENRHRELINNGVIYHEIFSRIDTVDDLPRALESLRKEGVIRRDEIADKQKFIENAIAYQALQNHHWFDGTYKLYNECNLLYLDNGVAITKRPDRVMVNDKEAIVIDYKFGGKNEGYDEQVTNYRERLHKLLKKPVRAYLWYVTSNTINEV